MLFLALGFFAVVQFAVTETNFFFWRRSVPRRKTRARIFQSFWLHWWVPIGQNMCLQLYKIKKSSIKTWKISHETLYSINRWYPNSGAYRGEATTPAPSPPPFLVHISWFFFFSEKSPKRTSSEVGDHHPPLSFFWQSYISPCIRTVLKNLEN